MCLRLDYLVIQDMKRAFDADAVEPRALMLCLLADFWLSQLLLGPLIIITYRGAWMVNLTIRNQLQSYFHSAVFYRAGTTWVSCLSGVE